MTKERKQEPRQLLHQNLFQESKTCVGNQY